MKQIPLTRGKCAIVDDDDYERLMKHKWFAVLFKNGWYAARCLARNCGKQKTLLMHREIMSPPTGMQCDHINHNALDNRKSNLRIVTASENQHNCRKRKDNTSGHKGVVYSKAGKKWYAQISVNGGHKYLGSFSDKIAAAHAYDRAARELFGEYACLNFPDTNKLSELESERGNG